MKVCGECNGRTTGPICQRCNGEGLVGPGNERLTPDELKIVRSWTRSNSRRVGRS